MRLTGANKRELKVLDYFTPGFLESVPITDEDTKLYFDWSDRGKGKPEFEVRVADENRTKQFTGLSRLYWAKQRRDLQIAMYLEDWGSTCNSTDFVDEPREMVEFVSKAMRKPGIWTMWKLHNEPEKLDCNDRVLLQPLAVLAGLSD